jgi:hypothetical protein
MPWPGDGNRKMQNVEGRTAEASDELGNSSLKIPHSAVQKAESYLMNRVW